MTTKRMEQNDLADEIAEMQAHGAELVTIAELDRRLNVLGYERDKSSRCAGIWRNLTNGRSYPGVNYGIREIDTKMSAFHYQARRDDKFKALQGYDGLRMNTFCAHNGAILGV